MIEDCCEGTKPVGYGSIQEDPWMFASEALGIAVFKKIGLVDVFDEYVNSDHKISPGLRAMLMVGTSCGVNQREKLYRIQSHYESAPLDRILGGPVERSALSGEAFGNFLEDVYRAGASTVFSLCASRVKAFLEIASYIYNVDFSNTTIISQSTEHRSENVPPDAHHNMFGKSKEGKDDCVQINYSAIVNAAGFLEYLSYHDGNTADPKMMSSVLDYIDRVMSDERIVIVADCKMVNMNIIDRVEWMNHFYVSKCPDSFSENIKARVVKRALAEGTFERVGSFGKRKNAPEFEACEIHERLENGELCRFIAYRPCDRPHSFGFLKSDGEKRWTKATAGMKRKHFETEDEAQRAASEILDAMKDTAYAVTVDVVQEVKPGKRSKRGKPSKYDPEPEPVTTWRLSFQSRFDETKAQGIVNGSDIRVIITNLPESEVECDDIREGSTTKQVMQAYFGQWKVEYVFGDMKSQVGADRLYVHNENRQEALLTIIGVSTLVKGVIQYVIRNKLPELRKQFPTMTVQSVFSAIRNVIILCTDTPEGKMITFYGSEANRQLIITLAEALGITPAELAGY